MKYYCLGIKGAGMATLANILYDLGNEVIGYDDVVDHKFTQEGLDKRGIKIYNDNNHPLDKDLIVTHSVALKEDHKEIVRAKKNGLQIKKYNEILGDITNMFESICVSGTHGKTTTSTMISQILDQVYKVNYFIGDGTGYANKDNKIFVIESDEFNRHFLAYHPAYTVITNIELEHTEIYKDIEDIRNTFEKFANKTKNTIVAFGDNENVRMLKLNPKTIYYGFNKDNDVYAENVTLTDEGSEFDLVVNKENVGHFKLPLFGKHMVLNAMAAITICHLEGVSYERIEELLANFKNAKRRFAIENIKNNVIIDDYAHHPTEIKVTHDSASEKYPDKKIIAVFMPNTYSRTEALFDDFVKALSLYDKSYVTEIKCDRERQEDYPNINSTKLINEIPNCEMISLEDIDKLKDLHNTVICFMSCANISPLVEKTKEILK
jgi:UDP-N-acetylmuramate--alanine ligase